MTTAKNNPKTAPAKTAPAKTASARIKAASNDANAKTAPAIVGNVIDNGTPKNTAIANAIATSLAGTIVPTIDDRAACGGGIMDAGIVGEVYHVKDAEWKTVYYFVLPEGIHSRVRPADYFDGDAKLAWYVEPTAKQLQDPSFTTASIRDNDGNIHRFKGDSKGNPVRRKMALRTFVNSLLDGVRMAALESLRETDPANYRKLGAHPTNRVRIRCIPWNMVE